MGCKRILQFQPYASHVGGVDTVLLQLVRGLVASGYDLHIALPGPSPYVERYIEAGASVHFVPTAVFGKPTSSTYYLTNLSKLLPNVRELVRIIRRERIDLVHTHKMEAVAGNIAARWCNVPAVHTVHEIAQGRARWGYQIVGAIDNLFANRVIVLCDASKSMFTWFGNQSRKIIKIYNGITAPSSSLVSREATRRENGIADNAKVVLCVARISPMKGIEFLVQAAAQVVERVPEATILIVGGTAFAVDEPYFEDLKVQAENLHLGEKLRFLGLRRDVPQLMSAADLFVLPSVYDIFPTVLLEAMAAKLPIVATKVGGTPEIVRDNGVLTPTGDSNALADAIIQLLSDEDAARKMGNVGAALFEQEFTADQYVSRTQEVYDQLLTGCR